MNECKDLIEAFYRVKNNTEDFDAVYEDYIIQLIGEEWFRILKEEKLIETCGVINGRQLYVLYQ